MNRAEELRKAQQVRNGLLKLVDHFSATGRMSGVQAADDLARLLKDADAALLHNLINGIVDSEGVDPNDLRDGRP